MKKPTNEQMPLSLDQVQPDRLYPAGVACRLIPGRNGHLSLSSLHRWIQEQVIQAVSRPTAHGRKSWFIRGSEIIRMALPQNKEPIPRIRTPRQRNRDMELARKKAIQHGLIVEETR